MSIDSLAIDFSSNLTFDLPSVTNASNGLMVPSIKKVNRNRQCIPSDDEEEDDDSDDEYILKSASKPIKKSCPLPSDDEGDDEGLLVHSYSAHQRSHVPYDDDGGDDDDDDDDDDDKALITSTHLQQLYYKQKQHQAQLAQFNQHKHHSIYQHSNKSWSGMDLLKQLEQEKLDSKKIKPKLDTTNVKMKGLLASLPEPGSHNINFQQMQQQQKQYLDPHMHLSRSPSPNYSSKHISKHYRK